MAIIKVLLSMHNKEKIAEKKTVAKNCHCIVEPEGLPSHECQIKNILYKAQVTSILEIYIEKYITKLEKTHQYKDLSISLSFCSY